MRYLTVFCLLFLSSSPMAVFAQSADEIIDEIITTAHRRDSDLDLPGNIAQLSQSQLEDIGLVQIEDALVRVPGAGFQQGNGQEYLPSIRSAVLTGAGACGGFLTAQDNIPLRAAGFCNLNELFEANTEQARRIEIIRGPSNALYGSNALQGVINVLLPEAPKSAQGSFGLEVGANDFRREKLSYGTRSGQHGFLVNMNATHDGGYRDDAYYDQQKLQLRHEYDGDTVDIATTVTASNLNQETAGFVVGTDAYKDRDIAEANANPEAYRDARSFRLYSRIDYAPRDGHLLSITPYLRKTNMDFLQHFLPGNPLEENGQQSVGAQLTWYDDSRASLHWIVGLDLEITDGFLKETQFQTSFPSRPLGKHYDYQVDAQQLAPYINVDWIVSDSWMLNFGARYESMAYDYDNKMLEGDTDENGVPCPGGCRYSRPADRSDDFNNFSPKLGLVYKLGESHSLFSNLSNGFRAPQATELYRLQGGQVVADLTSEEVSSFEIGLRGSLDKFRYEAVVYTMNKDNVIYRDNSDFSNVSDGKTEHLGLELELHYALNESWDLATVINFTNHKYDGTQFVNGVNVDGNYLDTAPKQFGSAHLGWRFSEHGRAELEWTHMSKYFTDINNAREYEGHDLLNLRVNWEMSEQLRFSARVLNLLDEEYAERADFAFGNDRYFPGEPRSIFFGMAYKF